MLARTQVPHWLWKVYINIATGADSSTIMLIDETTVAQLLIRALEIGGNVKLRLEREYEFLRGSRVKYITIDAKPFSDAPGTHSPLGWLLASLARRPTGV